MDCTFRTSEGRFNYRATAVIVSGGHLLAMRDELCTHYYLPGGESACTRQPKTRCDANSGRS